VQQTNVIIEVPIMYDSILTLIAVSQLPESLLMQSDGWIMQRLKREIAIIKGPTFWA
jgi:hypothetical protein